MAIGAWRGVPFGVSVPGRLMMNRDKKPSFWKRTLPDSHTHKLLLFVVVVLVLYLLARVVW